MNTKRIFSLYSVVLFYGLILFIIALFLKETSFSFKNLVVACIPFVGGKRWFVETYMLLMIFSPFLNKLLCSLTKKSYAALIIIQLLIFSVWPSFFPSAPILDGGYGLTNFITVYMIVGYYKLHGTPFKKWVLLGSFIVSVTAIFLFAIFKENAWAYCFIFNIIASVSLFLFVTKCKDRSCKVINVIASTTFGVYLIHSDVYLTNFIWQTCFQCEKFYGSTYYIFHMLLTVVSLFCICCVIDLLRQLLWKDTFDKLFKCKIFNYKITAKFKEGNG
jgi:hypothetical protein